MNRTKTIESKAVKSSLIYAGGNIIGQLAGFLMLPIYTRHLTPNDYGVVGLIIFTLGIMEALLGARLVQAVTKYYYDKETDQERNQLISSALILTFSTSSLLVLPIIFLKEDMSTMILGQPGYSVAFALFMTLFITQAIEGYGFTYLRIKNKPYLYVSLSIAKLTLQITTNIWLIVFENLGVLGVAISSALSSTVFAVILVIYTLFKTGLSFRLDVAWQQVRYCWPLWVGAIAGIYLGSSNRFYMRIFSSLEEIGLFELAVKFASIITVLVWGPFNQYWITERFSIYKNTNGQTFIFRDVFRFIVLLLMVFAFGISIFSSPVIILMADSSFHSAANAIPLLTFGTVFGCLATFCNFSFLVKEQTKIIPQILYLTAIVITIFYLTFIPSLGFIGASLALLLTYIIQFLYTLYRTKSTYDLKLDLKFLVQTSSLAGVFLVGITLTLETSNIWLDLIYRCLASLTFIFLVLILYLKDEDSRTYALSLMDILKNKLFNRRINQS